MFCLRSLSVTNGLVFLLLLLTVGPLFGQGRDTAFAVRKLFRQRRHGGEALASTGPLNVSSPGDVAAALVMGAVPTAVGLRQAARFSAQREAAILTSYANGWPIPADIRRKLRRKHFHRTSADLGR